MQRNKAKFVANKIDYLHSLDSLDLAKELNKLLTKPLKCFIEVSVNEEKSKNGIKINELDEFLKQIKQYEKIQIIGLMMMSMKLSSSKEKQEQFHQLKLLKENYNPSFNLSMGMSDDYLEAIKEDANYIRLGRILFN